MKRILIIGLIVLLVLPFTFATEYIGNLNADGEYYIKDTSPSEATPPTSSASSGGGGGGGPLITKEILTPETNESTIVNSVSNSQTSSKGGGNSLNDPKIIYEQNENFFSGLGGSVLSLFGVSEQSKLTGAAVGTTSSYKNIGYAAILFVFILGLGFIIIIRKIRNH